ncbi:MAG: hypothetical protein KKF56_04725 [Nanoarchaeota archaeon]|nr:hypothetical protein [Nanoarchaeota archaeon]
MNRGVLLYQQMVRSGELKPGQRLNIYGSGRKNIFFAVARVLDERTLDREIVGSPLRYKVRKLLRGKRWEVRTSSD